ncbi:MAG: NYN domain-containing protein [Desulfobacterales bacterium]|nr:NYN domain-containing protein [Desulfobacterales bacterium]
MSLHIVIDGYNLIHQSKSLGLFERQSLQDGRETLIERLALYRKVKHHPITVVFDGADAGNGMAARERRKGIYVVFSRPNESADSVIKRLVSRERERAVVVTSDKEIADFAAEHGAATIGSLEFENKMKTATLADLTLPGISEEEHPGWTPTTKKKGPSRRPPKRERKSRFKTRKL